MFGEESYIPVSLTEMLGETALTLLSFFKSNVQYKQPQEVFLGNSKKGD
jgi:hypothetical protein